MSRTRRNFSAKFKSDLVIELLKGEKDLNTLAAERKEKETYAKKVGQLTMQVDWLKKNLKKFLNPTTRVNLVQSLLKTKELPVSTGVALLDVNRTSIYYKGTPVSQEELDCFEDIF